MAEISRADALALISSQDMSEIWQDAAKTSAALSTFRQIKMTKKQLKVPILDALPAAPAGGAWINGDTGVKPTLDMGWANKVMEAEEIAGIVPIPENVLDDTDVDLWSEVKPRIAEYVGYHLDLAVFLGINAPPSFSDSIYEGAVNAGNVIDLSTYLALGTQAQGYDLGGAYNELFGLVEDDGFDANIAWSKKTMRRRLRNLRNGNGDLIYSDGLKGAEAGPSIWGTDLVFLPNGAMNADANVLGLAGQRDCAILGIRQDIEFKFLDQATLTTTDGSGNRSVWMSLAEQDCIALRFKMRAGFQIKDPMTWEGGAGAFPFAALVA